MRRVHPGSLFGLATILQQGVPRMTPEQAVNNAHQIIEGLHRLGLEIGPLAAFGPHEMEHGNPLDALDLAADMIEREMGRKPWLPD